MRIVNRYIMLAAALAALGIGGLLALGGFAEGQSNDEPPGLEQRVHQLEQQLADVIAARDNLMQRLGAQTTYFFQQIQGLEAQIDAAKRANYDDTVSLNTRIAAAELTQARDVESLSTSIELLQNRVSALEKAKPADNTPTTTTPTPDTSSSRTTDRGNDNTQNDGTDKTKVTNPPTSVGRGTGNGVSAGNP